MTHTSAATRLLAFTESPLALLFAPAHPHLVFVSFPNALFIHDISVIGGLVSGTYTKVPDGSIKNPSVVIKSPKDKVRCVNDSKAQRKVSTLTRRSMP